MGEVLRQSGGKPRYGICFAPTEYVERSVTSPFGNWAEKLIMENYVRKTSAVPGVTDFLDERLVPVNGEKSHPMGNPGRLLAFLERHNPSLRSKGQLWVDEFEAKGIKVPDMLTHKPSRHEYYEVKPGSPSGVRDGLKKMAVLDKMMAKFHLSYKAGTHYSPGKPDDVDITSRVPRIMNVMGGKLGIRKITVTLVFRRSGAPGGLIRYWVCIDMETEDELADEVIENVGRWYVLHIVREAKKAAAAAAPPIVPKIVLPNPAVARYVPDAAAMIPMLMRARPSETYALVGGPKLRTMLLFEQMERTKAMLRPELRNVQSASFLFRDRTMLVLGAIPAVTGTVVLIVAAAGVVGSGLASGSAAAAAPVVVELSLEAMAANLNAAGALGAGQAAANINATAFAAQATGAQMVKTAALGAGVLSVLAFGNSTSAAAAPSLSDVETIRVVPNDEILNPGVSVLGDLKMKDGSSGVLLGTVEMENGDGVFQALSPHRPPA